MKLRPLNLRSVHTAVAAGATASLVAHFGSRLSRCDLASSTGDAAPSSQSAMNASKHMPDQGKPVSDQGKPSSEPLVGPVELGYASVALRQEEGFELPRLRLDAHKVSMTDEGLQQGLATLEQVLALKAPFTILWDIRTVSLPTRAQLLKGTAWANAHREELDTYLAGIGVLQSSRVVKAVANLVIRLTRPSQPICITMDEKRVDEFARPIGGAGQPPRASRKQAGCAAASGGDDESFATILGVVVGVAAVALLVAASRSGGAASSGGSSVGSGRTGGPLDPA